MADDEFYKREDDRKWRELTNDRLVSLTSGEQVQNDRLDDLEASIGRLDKILRGDPGGGLIESIDQIEAQMRRLNAILMPDSVGNAGLINDVRRLISREDRDERRADRWWKGLVPIIVAIVSLAGLVITNLDRIAPHSKRPEAAVKQPAKKVKRRVVVAPVEIPHGTDEEMPE